MLYDELIVIVTVAKFIIYEASFDNDYLPEPPTPTNNACPAGAYTILVILQTCLIASSKRTNPINALLSLYSFKASYT